MIRRVVVETASGSRYAIDEDDDGFWLIGDNTVTADSRDIRGRRWAVEQPEPWPVVLGESVVLRARRNLAPDDPERMPGGGKAISPIVVVIQEPPHREPSSIQAV